MSVFCRCSNQLTPLCVEKQFDTRRGDCERVETIWHRLVYCVKGATLTSTNFLWFHLLNHNSFVARLQRASRRETENESYDVLRHTFSLIDTANASLIRLWPVSHTSIILITRLLLLSPLPQVFGTTIMRIVIEAGYALVADSILLILHLEAFVLNFAKIIAEQQVKHRQVCHHRHHSNKNHRIITENNQLQQHRHQVTPKKVQHN